VDDSFVDEPPGPDFAAWGGSAAAAPLADDRSPAAPDGWLVGDCPQDGYFAEAVMGDSAAFRAEDSFARDSPDADSDAPHLDLADWVLADSLAAGSGDDSPADLQQAQVVPDVQHSVDSDARR
jgi:hypothetical protein